MVEHWWKWLQLFTYGLHYNNEWIQKLLKNTEQKYIKVYFKMTLHLNCAGKISDQFRFPLFSQEKKGMQVWWGVGIKFWWHVMYETRYCGTGSVHIHVLIIVHNNFAWVTRIIKTANKSTLFSTLLVVLRLLLPSACHTDADAVIITHMKIWIQSAGSL